MGKEKIATAITGTGFALIAVNLLIMLAGYQVPFHLLFIIGMILLVTGGVLAHKYVKPEDS